MNCYKCKKIIDKIHDNSIDNNELQSVLHHIEECESCNIYYTVMNEMLKDLSSFEEMPLPDGFHNRLHFALKREIESPASGKRRVIGALKLAAAGAFSILLVLAAVSLLPKTKLESMQYTAMDEAVEESMDTMLAETEMESAPKEYSEAMAAEFPAEDNAAEDSVESAAFEEAAVLEEAFDEIPNGGDSFVIILDTENPDQTYDELLEILNDPLPEVTWMLENVEEPESYRQIRITADLERVYELAQEIAVRYSENVVYYMVETIEYDDYSREIANLQNAGYVFVLIK